MESYTFNLKTLEKYIKILTDNYTLKLNELDNHPEINTSYHAINEISEKDDIINLILKQYRPSQIMPETIGSFLFGCFQQTYGDIPAECSPLCAYSIRNNDDDVALEKCNSQIHIQYLDDISDDGISRFIKLGKSTSTQGYIFVKLNFMGFTFKEREYLRENGLYKVQLLVTKDSKHHTVIKMRDIDDLPIIEKNKSGQVYLSSESNMKDSTETHEELDENTYVYIVLAVIIVGIMIVVYNK